MESRLPTGEPLRTKLGRNNVSRLEDAIRHPEERPDVDAWVAKKCFHDGCAIGECAHSMAALMRYLDAKGDATSIEKARECLKIVKSKRDGSGRWKGFPFYYTLLAISELGTEDAMEELAYAAPACSRMLARIKNSGDGADFRREILTRVVKSQGIARDL